MLAIYETEYGNFGTPEDIFKYMCEENISSLHITVKLCGQVVGFRNSEMSLEDIKKWIAMGKEE